MEISPLDIRNQTFRKKSLGGYDPEEVHAFLEQVAAEMEKQVRARNDFNERLKITEERVNYYKLIEKTLQDSVVTMQKTVEEAKQNAEKEAELLIAEAKVQANRESERIRSQADELRAEIENLKTMRNHYFIRIRSLIRGQEELLEAMEREDQAVEHSGMNTETLMFRKKRLSNDRVTGQQPQLQPGSRPAPDSNGGNGNQTGVPGNSGQRPAQRRPEGMRPRPPEGNGRPPQRPPQS